MSVLIAFTVVILCALMGILSVAVLVLIMENRAREWREGEFDD